MLQIGEKTHEGIKLFILSGKFDFYSAEAFMDALAKVVKEGMNHIIVDISKIPFLDSPSLGIIVSSQKKLVANNGGMVLVIDLESEVGKVLTMTALHKLIPIFGTQKEALESFAPPVVKD